MAKRSAALALAAALAATLAGCATPTPYQPNIGRSSTGGYSEVRIETNRWRVNFAGNTLTSRETVEGYLLFRSAELSMQQGFDWFHIVDRDTERHTETYLDPDPLYHPWYGPGYGYWRPSWRYYGAGYGWRSWDPFWGDPFWADRIDVHTFEKYEATAEIVMGHGPKPADDPRAFDARQVITNLQPRIQYPQPKK
jgi:hypothetical protein